ncbi:alpha/beta fold hydrolase [Streptomyces halobius]|uniref:prolyl aminopeptidase n=1 Tax=Streptomyces halobius TaxID=2879846 RepID=A0ABY4M4D5_9ACTN|nr:alpha/beta fold hydrolase [Streptomyces halobius]UQA92267.1 alpha/beta fold hydrolase [Streptomyces halobius]
MFDVGMFDADDGNRAYGEVRGNPDGKPALVVHGGPGSGCTARVRRYFDPDRYRVVLFDQRGCGRSTPHASDPATDMRHNTTEHLLADMERLREHLDIDRWLLFGGSWGSALILAYAQRHPDRVSDIVIPSVTTTRRSEIDWLYRGVGRFFPEEWERFLAGAPGVDRDGDIVGASARLMEDPDPAVRDKATADWCAWEDAVLSLQPHGAPTPYEDRPSVARQALVRIWRHKGGGTQASRRRHTGGTTHRPGGTRHRPCARRDDSGARQGRGRAAPRPHEQAGASGRRPTLARAAPPAPGEVPSRWHKSRPGCRV